MSNYYNLEGIKNMLQKEIAKDSALLAEWKKVTFPTKKDGQPFAIMSKNIQGARYVTYEYGFHDYEKQLKIGCFASGCGFVNDEIDLYVIAKYLKDEKKIAKKENYMPKEQYLEQIYKFDLDDIKQAVADRIQYLENLIASHKRQLELAETAYNNFQTAYKTALENLCKDTECKANSLLYCAIKETIAT